jgi:pyruvate/2-oxoglutarate dehydrogenase complex dihydrolipoamide acyltransferase (E2) component
MSDRRYEREPEERPSPSSLHEMVDATVRRISTSMVLAGGLIAIGLYAGGGTSIEAPPYQITTSADGQTVYRLNTDSGSIVACRDNQCWLMQYGSRDLEDEPPAPSAPPARLPAPATTPAEAPAPAQAPAAAPAPAPAPAPANR